MKNILVLLLVILFISCTEDSQLERDNLSGPEINIYLVASEAEEDFYNSMENLSSLETEQEPWLKHSEILFYDWSSHMFFLKDEKKKEEFAGRTFILKADENPLFAGVFFPIYMSSFPQMPSIIAQDGIFEPMDVVSFGQFGYVHSGQMNTQQSFKEALAETGLLKKGIKVELTRVVKVSSTKLEYTFSVTNEDLENIYVLDPRRMGSAKFHYYTNGVSIYDGTTYYYPTINSIPSEKIKESWYFRLHPGETMTRTVSLGDFGDLPSGSVTCRFAFPGSKLEAGVWLKSDGRVWLGNYLVEKELNLH